MLVSAGLLHPVGTKAKLHEDALPVNRHFLTESRDVNWKQTKPEMNTESRCPKCLEGRLKSWVELNEEEREVVRRLPDGGDYLLTERQRRHTWCTRCWHEQQKQISRA